MVRINGLVHIPSLYMGYIGVISPADPNTFDQVGWILILQTTFISTRDSVGESQSGICLKFIYGQLYCKLQPVFFLLLILISSMEKIWGGWCWSLKGEHCSDGLRETFPETLLMSSGWWFQIYFHIYIFQTFHPKILEFSWSNCDLRIFFFQMGGSNTTQTSSRTKHGLGASRRPGEIDEELPPELQVGKDLKDLEMLGGSSQDLL